MSQNNISTQELADKIDQLASEQKDLKKEMRAFRDFMVIQLDRQKRVKVDGSFDWQTLLKQAITALIVALGVLGVVIQGLGNK